jgi:glucan phosphoethanolaminetransferase (alkaline phosphatase superfamily)
LVVNFLNYVWKDRFYLLSVLWPLLLPILAFIVFIVVNKSIVMGELILFVECLFIFVTGDKENHIPGLHPAMLVHMTFIFLLLAIPILLDSIHSVLPSVRGFNAGFHFLLLCLAFVFGSLLLIWGSKSHPFLLSDNRSICDLISLRFLLFFVGIIRFIYGRGF